MSTAHTHKGLTAEHAYNDFPWSNLTAKYWCIANKHRAVLLCVYYTMITIIKHISKPAHSTVMNAWFHYEARPEVAVLPQLIAPVSFIGENSERSVKWNKKWEGIT